MTVRTDFNGVISDWLDEQAGRGAPDYLDEILSRTTRTRQRPAWSSLERLLPMQMTLRLAPVPKIAWLVAILGLVIALSAAALLVAGSRPHLASPFGLAANGVIAYGAADGDIHAYDPSTGASRLLVADPAHDETPEFAPDGSRFVFARQADANWMLMVADADGSNVRPLTGSINPEWNAWAPDSRRVAVVDTLPTTARLSVYSIDGAAPQHLAVDPVELVGWRSSNEIVYVGHTAEGWGLFSVTTDGSRPRPLVPQTADQDDWIAPVMPTDGTAVAWTEWTTGPTIRVLDLGSGKVRTVSYEGSSAGDGWPTSWSPDGQRFVFNRWNGTENHLAVGSIAGGPVIETGPAFPDFTDGAAGLFSPDGTRIVTRYGKDPDAIWILDPDGGPGERILSNVPAIASWQRIATP